MKKMLQTLINHGANPEICIKYPPKYKTAINYARAKCKEEIVAILEKAINNRNIS